jgi:hypothetical protein
MPLLGLTWDLRVFCASKRVVYGLPRPRPSARFHGFSHGGSFNAVPRWGEQRVHPLSSCLLFRVPSLTLSVRALLCRPGLYLPRFFSPRQHQQNIHPRSACALTLGPLSKLMRPVNGSCFDWKTKC